MANKPVRVSNSVAINIVPPKGFSLSGDTKVVSEEQKSPPEEEILTQLYNHLERLENLKQDTIKLIGMVKKKFGCSNCDK